MNMFRPIRLPLGFARGVSVLRFTRFSLSLIMMIASCAWAATGGRKSVAPPASLSRVFEVERHAEKDQLLLSQGERLSGSLLNSTLRLRASYALLVFDLRMIAGLEQDPEGRRSTSVLTVNSNRFSGILEDPSVSFQLASGQRIEVRREKIIKLIRPVHPQELGGIPRGQWISLKNGDEFSGKILADSLVVTSLREKKQVRWADLASLVFHSGDLPAISLRQGDVLRGTLNLEDLPVLLDIGPKLNLYTDYIATIGDHSISPAGLAARAESSKIPYATSISGQSTNVQGMVWISAGKFAMGSPSGEVGRDQDEGPQTQVMIEQGFWIGKYEVTQADYLAITGSNPSNNTEDPSRPVEKVNWHEAMEFCDKLNQLAQAARQLPDGYLFRLPTEAEWEYACRAGTITRFSFGEDKSYALLGNHAWFVQNSDSMTHPVGKLKPNPWGLHDMHGNVWEWCLDRWEGLLPGGSVTNLPSRSEGTLRVARGGSWLYEGWACRSANRDDLSPANRCSDVGFRVVLAPILP